MDGITSLSQFEDYTHSNKYVVYVNPRQYDRIMRRRIERDRFMQRRGKPKPVYVPIAVRDFSLRFLQNDNFLLNFGHRRKNCLRQNISNRFLAPVSNNINIYINSQANSLNNLNTSMNSINNNNANLGNMSSYSMYNNGCLGMFNYGLNMENTRPYSSFGSSGLDRFSPKRVGKHNLSSPYNRDYHTTKAAFHTRENNHYPKGANLDRDPIPRFNRHLNKNDLYTSYENFLISTSLAAAPSSTPRRPASTTNLFSFINLNSNTPTKANGCTTNNLKAASNMFMPNCASALITHSSMSSNTHSCNSSLDKESSRDKDNSSVCSLSSREEIKNNYLHLTYSPFSNSSIDSEVVPKTEQIYNINEQGIVIDASPQNDAAAGVNNPSLFEGEFAQNGEASVTENMQDYNYIANTSFLDNAARESYDTHLQTILIGEPGPSSNAVGYTTDSRSSSTMDNLTTNTSSTINEQELTFNTAKTASISSVATVEKGKRGSYQGKAASGLSSRHGENSYLYRQLYNCF